MAVAASVVASYELHKHGALKPVFWHFIFRRSHYFWHIQPNNGMFKNSPTHFHIHSYCSHSLLSPVPSPNFPLCFICACQTCQYWRVIHTSQDSVGTKSWITWCEMLRWRMGKRGMPLESKVHAASCTIYIHAIRMPFRILTTSSHRKEMRSSCPACGGDNENMWPELAPCWQWRLLGLSGPEELAARDSALQSISDLQEHPFQMSPSRKA